jgi:chromosome segregation ATPase
MEQSIKEQREKLSGMQTTAESQKQLSKTIRVNENRLDKAHQKFNQTVAHNRQLREQINQLRKDKNIYEASYKRLEQELEEKRVQMKASIEAANSAYSKRAEILQELETLKAENDREQKKYEEEWEELTSAIEQEKKRKEFIQMKEREKQAECQVSEILPEDEQKIQALAKLSEAEKESTNASLALVKNYEEALAKITEETGVKSLEELVESFLRYEEKNSTLTKFVNELSSEIEELEKQIAGIKEEINRYKEEGAVTDTSKKRLLQKLESKLSAMEFRNQVNDTRLSEAMKTLAFIREQIKSFLQTLGADEALIAEMDDQGLTEANLMRYLAEVETRANKLVQSYALLQAQKLQVEALLKEDPTLHRSSIAALNNVMALAYQSLPQTTEVKIELPPFLEQDEGNDEDAVVLSADEIRARAERHLSNWKAGRPIVKKSKAK